MDEEGGGIPSITAVAEAETGTKAAEVGWSGTFMIRGVLLIVLGWNKGLFVCSGGIAVGVGPCEGIMVVGICGFEVGFSGKRVERYGRNWPWKLGSNSMQRKHTTFVCVCLCV